MRAHASILMLFAVSIIHATTVSNLLGGRILNYDGGAKYIDKTEWTWFDDTVHTPWGGSCYYYWCLNGVLAATLLHYEHPIAWRFNGRGSDNSVREVPQESNIYPWDPYFPNFNGLKQGWTSPTTWDPTRSVALSARNSGKSRATHNTARDEVTRFYLAAHRALNYGDSYPRVLSPINHYKYLWAIKNLGYHYARPISYTSTYGEDNLRDEIMAGNAVIVLSTGHAYHITGYRSSDSKFQVADFDAKEWLTYSELGSKGSPPVTFIAQDKPDVNVAGTNKYQDVYMKGDAFIAQSDRDGDWYSDRRVYYVKPAIENRASHARDIKFQVHDQNGFLLFQKQVTVPANGYWIADNNAWKSFTVYTGETRYLNYSVQALDGLNGNLRFYMVENGY